MAERTEVIEPLQDKPEVVAPVHHQGRGKAVPVVDTSIQARICWGGNRVANQSNAATSRTRTNPSTDSHIAAVSSLYSSTIESFDLVFDIGFLLLVYLFIGVSIGLSIGSVERAARHWIPQPPRPSHLGRVAMFVR